MKNPKSLELEMKERELTERLKLYLEENCGDISNKDLLELSMKTIPIECIPDKEETDKKFLFSIGKKCLKRIKDEKGTSLMQGNADGNGFYHMSKSESGRNLINTINKGESTIKGVRKTVTKAKIELNTPRITKDGIKNLWEDYKEVEPVKIPEDLIMDM